LKICKIPDLQPDKKGLQSLANVAQADAGTEVDEIDFDG